ncbi:MAG: EcsC family protein [Elusimicrobia bacterium]|nr:EcsC family protein [Elusimicrobiota bacterium]
MIQLPLNNFLDKSFDVIYNKAVNGGIPGMSSAYQLAQDYKVKCSDLNKQISSLINHQCGKSALAGFVTNLGGAVTLPIAIPSNILWVLYLQLRMIAAIAILCGYKPNNDKVQTIALCCLVGDSLSSRLKKAGIDISKKIGCNMINKISSKVLKKINKAIGFKLISKYGGKATINLSKFVPLAGGVIAGGIDAFSTKSIGSFAKKTFISQETENFVYAA